MKDNIDFEKQGGLVPAIAQDYLTGEGVLRRNPAHRARMLLQPFAQ